jgi:hypothetical protein
MIVDPRPGRFNVSAATNTLPQRQAINTLQRRGLWSVPCAGVLIKALLRHAIEGKRGDGALSRGATTPHGQREQHQPVKFSSSAQIMCLVIGAPSLWTSTEGWTSARGEKSCRCEGRVRHELLPAAAPTLPGNGEMAK